MELLHMVMRTVPRPQVSRVSQEVIDKLVESAKSPDIAVEILLDKDTHFINWQQDLRIQLKKRNLKARLRLDKQTMTVTAWAESL